MPKKAAIIDMGTNTFHLLLVNLNETTYEVIYKEKVPVKIGQGGISQNHIHPDAELRAFETLVHFKGLMDVEGIDDIFAFATSGVRNATNGQAFVKKIKETFGIDVLVIDGQEEAQMIYEGIRFSGSLTNETSLMIDIGGGSVEFIIGNKEEALWRKSFEIGGQRLLDLFHYHDPILPVEVQKLTLYLEGKLSELAKAIKTYNPTALVGASGTFDTLSDIYFASLDKNKALEQTVFQLPTEEFHNIAKMLLTQNREERMQIPGMIPLRVDMIVVASCLIKYILQLIPVSTMVCSSYALKEGAIARLMGKDSQAVLLNKI